MRRRLLACMLVGTIGLSGLASAQRFKQSENDTTPIPRGGYVPTAKVAEQIAYAVLVPVYGQKEIDSQRPFKTSLVRRGANWRVEGTLPEFVAQGGTFVLEIAKRDGRIVRMVHYQ